MSPRPPARRLVTAPPLELVAPDPMGGQALPPLPSQRLPSPNSYQNRGCSHHLRLLTDRARSTHKASNVCCQWVGVLWLKCAC